MPWHKNIANKVKSAKQLETGPQPGSVSASAAKSLLMARWCRFGIPNCRNTIAAAAARAYIFFLRKWICNFSQSKLVSPLGSRCCCCCCCHVCGGGVAVFFSRGHNEMMLMASSRLASYDDDDINHFGRRRPSVRRR